MLYVSSYRRTVAPDYIIIDKSEKYDRMNKEYYIDKTKNGKSRVFTITDRKAFKQGYLRVVCGFEPHHPQ